MSAPRLRGFSFPAEMLREFYAGAVERMVGEWIRTHP